MVPLPSASPSRSSEIQDAKFESVLFHSYEIVESAVTAHVASRFLACARYDTSDSPVPSSRVVVT